MNNRYKKISVLLAAIMIVASCGNGNAEETTETLVNVTKEGLGYEVNGSTYEEVIETEATEESTTEETTTTTKVEETETNAESTSITTVPTEATTTTTTQTTNGNYVSTEKYENIYNSTVEKNLENVRFGEIKISYYEDGFVRYDVNDYIKDFDINNFTEQDEKKLIEALSQNKSEYQEYIYTTVKVGEHPYDIWHYSLANIKGGVSLSSAIVTHRNEEERKDVVDEYNINVVKDADNKYEYKFKGAGHYYYNIGDMEIPSFYLETEQEGYIIDPQKLRGLILDEGQYISVKAFAMKLNSDVEEVTSSGYAKLPSDNFPIAFIAKTENEIFELEVGMPFSKLTEILGQGEKLTETIKSEIEGEEDTVNEYYVYKTTDYTLVVQRSEYPDIKRPQFYDETLPNTVELVSTIILIDNVTTSFPKPVEETTSTVSETSAAPTDASTEDTTATQVEKTDESNVDTTTTVTT